jgi:hypothetical protein
MQSLAVRDRFVSFTISSACSICADDAGDRSTIGTTGAFDGIPSDHSLFENALPDLIEKVSS